MSDHFARLRRRRRLYSAPGVRRGLTLVELTIVVLLVGLLMSLLFGSMFGLTQITSQASPISIQRGRAFLALDNIRSAVDQVFFHRDTDRLWFLGTREGSGERRFDRLTFSAVHANADRVGVPAVREVSYYLKEMPDQNETLYTLYRREDSMVDDEPGQGGQHYELLQNVVSLMFRYTLNGRDWEDNWDSTKRRRIPRMIQIQLRVKIGPRIAKFETLSQPGLYIR